MDRPLITCVLLTTNPKRAAYLPDAIRSYRAQTYTNKELLIVNDGEPLQSNAPDIRVVNLVKRLHRWTIGEKRNVGIRMAHGDWLASWDDDDISLGHRLEEQMVLAKKHAATCVFADRLAVSDDEMSVVGTCSLPQFSVMASVLMTRDAAVRSGGYSTNDFAEDKEMIYRIATILRGRCLTFPSDWYVMRRHDTNITNQFGGSADVWVRCALKDPKRIKTQAAVDKIRAIDVSKEVFDAPVASLSHGNST